jgi:hypothetical protein
MFAALFGFLWYDYHRFQKAQRLKEEEKEKALKQKWEKRERERKTVTASVKKPSPKPKPPATANPSDRPPSRGPVKCYTTPNGVKHYTTQGEEW